jgi:hypothetical protein
MGTLAPRTVPLVTSGPGPELRSRIFIHEYHLCRSLSKAKKVVSETRRSGNVDPRRVAGMRARPGGVPYALRTNVCLRNYSFGA